MLALNKVRIRFRHQIKSNHLPNDKAARRAMDLGPVTVFLFLYRSQKKKYRATPYSRFFRKEHEKSYSPNTISILDKFKLPTHAKVGILYRLSLTTNGHGFKLNGIDIRKHCTE